MSAWTQVSVADPRARALRDRHYSTRRPGGRTVGPPGQRVVFVTEDGSAAWITHYPAPGLALDRRDALRCSLFRNESLRRSSDLIREAMERSEELLGRPPDGWLTYVEPAKVASTIPGYCFRRAGFRRDRSFVSPRLIRLRRRCLA